MHAEKALDIRSEWIFVGFMAHLLKGENLGSPTSVSLPAVLPSSITVTPEESFPLTQYIFFICFYVYIYIKSLGRAWASPTLVVKQKIIWYVYVHSALFLYNAMFPHVRYLYNGIREKSSNLDSSVETMQGDRDRRVAERAQQLEAQLRRWNNYIWKSRTHWQLGGG